MAALHGVPVELVKQLGWPAWLGQAFHDDHLEALAAMTAAQRSEHGKVRQAMYAYADVMWDGLKRRGLAPADHPEEYNSVAALRDLTSELVSHLGQAQEAASDIEDD